MNSMTRRLVLCRRSDTHWYTVNGSGPVSWTSCRVGVGNQGAEAISIRG